jgi:hypothetical protein
MFLDFFRVQRGAIGVIECAIDKNDPVEVSFKAHGYSER